MRMASIWTQAKKILCPRRPRGFQFMGFGRMMNPVGRTTTPVEKLLALAGLQYLGANTPYMFYPNDPSRSASNRHYLYSSAGWNAGTLSAGSEKNWVNRNTSQFVNTPAGNLTPGCIIEAACTKLCTNIASFGNFGAGKSTGQADALGGSTAITLTEDSSAGAAHYVQSSTITVPKNTRIACTLWVRRIAGTRNVNVYLNQGSNYTYVKVNLTTLACTQLGGGDGVAPTDAVAEVIGSFIRITFTGIISAGTANGQYTIYMSDDSLSVVYDGDGVSSLRLCHTMIEALPWVSTCVAGAAGTVRAADALRFTGLSGLATAGGILAMLRLPYASAVPSADVTHLSVNGADSADNMARIYTDTDNHLYAEVLSGGVSQGTVDCGTYLAGTQYAICMDWDSSGLRACINGVEKTATGAITVPASIDRLEVGRGISTDTAHGGETPGILLFNSVRTVAERAALTGAALKAAFFAGI